MKISIGIVLYFPTENNIEQLKKINKLGYNIYIYDNTDSNEDASENESIFLKYSNFHYYGNRYNDGVSKALNELCRIAITNKDSFLITLDQDSIFSTNELQKYILNFKYIFETETNIGMFGPEIIYLDDNNKPLDIQKRTTYFDEVEWIITSGSAINLKAYNETEGFDEKYFIDRVDADYCQQLLMLNYKNIRVNNVYLYQKLGDETKTFRNIRYSLHSPSRQYYIFRNRFYFNHKYYKGLNKYFRNLCGSLRQISLILLFEDKRVIKLLNVAKGFRDYIKGSFGEI